LKPAPSAPESMSCQKGESPFKVNAQSLKLKVTASP
jgi:hypothetical protein